MNHENGKKIVLVTGASRGLGRELALGLGSSGYRLAVHCHSREHGAGEVAGAIQAAGGEALVVAADLSLPAEADRMVQQVLEAWGGIHVLINNAGIVRDRPVVSMSEQEWDDVIGVDLSGPFHVMRAVSGPMQEQGGGEIVNVVSIAGVRGSSGQANYAAAKAGLIGLTRVAALEWGSYNIKVNAVSPGFMETDMTGSVLESVKDRALALSCFGKYCDPGDVVSFVESLIRMQGVTGQVFHLDSRIV